MTENLRTLFHYNSRILLANSYWLLIIPLVAAQLVIFWHMAVATLVSAADVAKTCELVIPLLAAFLCAHVVAPEQRDRVDEITFVRPVPFARTIILRVVALYAILTILAMVMLYVYKFGLKKEFSLGPVLLAGIPSTFFLSALSLAFAAAWRSPAAGIGAALLYWVGDAARGAQLNPLASLHGYAAELAAQARGEDPASTWLLSKAVLLGLTLILVWIIRQGLTRPASPKRWRAGLRLACGASLCVVAYLGTGAWWQLSSVRGVEEANPTLARFTYRQAFEAYAPMPVAHLFGPAFAEYIGYDLPGRGTHRPASQASAADAPGKERRRTIQRLTRVADRWPDGEWGDNALYEVIKLMSVAEGESEEARLANRVSVQRCRAFLDRYPTSAFASQVLARMVLLARSVGDEEAMMWAYQRVTSVYAGTASASLAAAELRAYYLDRGQVGKAIEAARTAAESASPEAKPEVLMDFAAFLARQGRVDEARDVYMGVEEAVQGKLDALGLAVLTLENATPENLKRRSDIIRLRGQALEGLAAMDRPAATTDGGDYSP